MTGPTLILLTGCLLALAVAVAVFVYAVADRLGRVLGAHA